MSGKIPDWKAFELRVAELYRDLGAIKVECDVNICGNQVDVYAEIPAPDGLFLRYVVSCKHYNGLCGVDTVREWILVVNALRQAHKADVGVIVGRDGFTRPAKELAAASSIRTVSLNELEWANTDLNPYLREVKDELEKVHPFAGNHYIPARLKYDDTDAIQAGVDVIDKFLKDDASPLLLILGDFGSGKTTLTRDLFLRLASDRLNDPPKEVRTPILINLKDYSGAFNLRGLLIDELASKHSARCANFASLKKLMMRGKILLILDAFDEMATRTSKADTIRHFDEILELCKEESKVIVTSRTHFFKSDADVQELAARGTELLAAAYQRNCFICHVEPFSESEIERYVKSVCTGNHEEVLSEIRKTYDLSGLATRPILLRMITEVLPDLIASNKRINAAALYSQYVDSWLKRDDWRVELDVRARYNFTMAFAYNLYLSGKSVFSHDELAAAVRNEFPNTTNRDLALYENDIRTCTFITRRGDTFEFAHRSFMEFFVAARLYKDIIKGDSERFEGRQISKVVLGFLAEHMGTEEARRNIRSWLLESKKGVLSTNVLRLLAIWENGVTGAIPCLQVSDATFEGRVFHKCDTDEFVCSEVLMESCEIQSVEAKTANWRDTEFYKCALKATRALRGDFRSVRFHECRLTEFRLDDAFFEACGWKDCVCERVHLRDCDFVSCSFDACGPGMTFMECRVKGCQFRDSRPLFEGCVIERAQFVNVDITKGRLFNTECKQCEFHGTQFAYDTLHSSRFEACKFHDVAFVFSGQPVSTNWKQPLFNKCTGLTAEVREKLVAHGAKIVD